MSLTSQSKPKSPGADPVADPLSAPAGVSPYRVLLLDVDSGRRLRRARALETKGAKVDDVSTGAQARARWQAGSHDMVLVDFQSARAEFDEFCDHMQATSQAQKVAYFIAEPPYLTSSRQKGEAGRHVAGSARGIEAPRSAEGHSGQARRLTFGEAIKVAEKSSGQGST